LLIQEAVKIGSVFFNQFGRLNDIPYHWYYCLDTQATTFILKAVLVGRGENYQNDGIMKCYPEVHLSVMVFMVG
jgi:hypothetical protein